ncbi:hypothetical protein BDB00DRAFT_889729 [Zychaea mexicana]|uniref:uncharacterized protein n=1 Tax=Zychaea mexicana TaxID=64656 RepID=UPI0022FDDF3A|nr:uncharacterized protein BDB00DRAFT_889729 [Zychaea mexicana]KAI9496843.1 hypothetical protein BDB00DRAFT_889729 [Zychaea mexicana]
MLTLDQAIFTSTLADEERKTIIERYPPIRTLKYSPPAAVPQADRLFKPGQKAEDAMLRQLQYTLSAVLRPLDVLGHTLLPILPNEHINRVFATINDVHTLVLHTASTINNQRNQLALRAIHPSLKAPSQDKQYTMSADTFKDTVTEFTAMQKSIRDARRGGNCFKPSSSNSSFF